MGGALVGGQGACKGQAPVVNMTGIDGHPGHVACLYSRKTATKGTNTGRMTGTAMQMSVTDPSMVMARVVES